MNLFKVGLRVWITAASLCSFLGGWIILAHAPKPVQTPSRQSVIAAPLPTLEPLPPLSGFGSGGDDLENQPVFGMQPRNLNRSRPFFTTGGS